MVFQTFISLLSLTIFSVTVQCFIHENEYYEKLFFEHIQQYKVEIKDKNDFDYRLTIFSSNVDAIEENNKYNSLTTWGRNKFSHLSRDEFKQFVIRGGFNSESKFGNYGEIHNFFNH